jgi:2'-5' RNA ligase
MKRTFIAIKIEPAMPLLDLISELKQAFKNENLKWVEAFNLHLTLHFIGKTSPSQVNGVIKMLRITTANKKDFILNLTGTGFFRGSSQPRVLLVNVDRNAELEVLTNEIAAGLTTLGLPGNLKSFSPHITLARLKKLQNLQLFHSTVAKFKSVYLQSAEVTEIIYYESILQPTGPVYIPIQKFKLK